MSKNENKKAIFYMLFFEKVFLKNDKKGKEKDKTGY